MATRHLPHATCIRVHWVCIATGLAALATTAADASLYGHTVSVSRVQSANPWWPDGQNEVIGELVAGAGVEYTYNQTVWDYGNADDPNDDVVSIVIDGYIDISEHSISWGMYYTSYLQESWLGALPCEFSGYTFDVLSATPGFITDASFNFNEHLDPTGYITDHIYFDGEVDPFGNVQDWGSSWWTDPSDPSRLALSDGTSLAMNHQGFYWESLQQNQAYHMGWTIDLATVPGPATLPLLCCLFVAGRRRARN